MCDTLERLILSVEVNLSQRDADLKVFTAGGQLRCQDWGDLYQWGVTPRRHFSQDGNAAEVFNLSRSVLRSIPSISAARVRFPLTLAKTL